MTDELYKVHRPTAFKQVLGQNAAINVLNDMGKRKAIPHALLFTGESGCGKTTLARILARKLHCQKVDFQELNCADFRGIDMVRNIRQTMNLSPMASPVRVYLIDEVHQLTSPAQDAFLKILEDTPDHIYFFLATTNPEKLKRTIRTRCTDIKVQALTHTDLTTLVERTVADEEAAIDPEIVSAIVDGSEGSARKALVLLHQIIGLDSTEEALAVIGNADTKRNAIEIARLLLDPKSTWAQVAAVLRVVDEDPEGIRWMVLSYASKVLMGRSNQRAAKMIAAFRDNFYDSKKAGLVLACFEVVEG